MQGILLLGMPGAGKSTVGREIAKVLGFRFFDGDEEIEKKYPDRQKFLDEYGNEAYLEMEVETISKLPVENSVLAPGGSIIYSDTAKRYLNSCFKVFLDISLETIKSRLKNIDLRGIVYLKEKGIEELYNERTQLYKAYADLTVVCEGKSETEVAQVIVAAYEKQSN